jgi:ribosomal protein S18 acetylase RimI-like enzyme
MNIRPAKLQDSLAISVLMDQLGYGASRELIEEKLNAFDKSSADAVFVAEIDGVVLGEISCHITRMLHQKGNSGRITSLVIDQNQRGLGIGKQLVAQAEVFFKSCDCIKSEVTSSEHRTVAHAFYESCGYERVERRYIKTYNEYKETKHQNTSI